MTNSDRLSTLVKRVDSAEERLKALEVRYNEPVNRVKRALLARGVYSAKFATVQPDYYDLTLDQRAELLGCTVPQLCKSIIFENTMHDPLVEDSRTNSKYYCVITQYTGKSSMALPTRVCVQRALAFSTCSVVVC
jgi:hypothetical protein